MKIGGSDGIVGLLDADSRRARPAELAGGRGRITPGKASALATILGSAALASLALLVSAASAGWTALALAGFLLLPGLFMVPSLTARHDVVWDDRGISGARRMFGPTLGWGRTTIAWPDIVHVGKTLTGYWYVQARDGQRVYWSYLYIGYPALVKRLARARPDLDLRPIAHEDR